MSVFIWNLYYPKAASVEGLLRQARRVVTTIAGQDFHVVGFGEQMLTIAFVSELTHEQLRDKIAPIDDEKLWTLLFEVAAVVGGVGRHDALLWLSRRLPAERKLPRAPSRRA